MKASLPPRCAFIFITPIIVWMLLLQRTTVVVDAVSFNIYSGQDFFCRHCCEEIGCTRSTQLSVRKLSKLGLDAEASCSGSRCDCYGNGAQNSVADITAMAKTAKKIIVNCTGTSATGITLNFIKAVKGKDGASWPYPYTQDCSSSNSTGAPIAKNGKTNKVSHDQQHILVKSSLAATAAPGSGIAHCPSGKIVPLNGTNAYPTCKSTPSGCSAVITSFPKGEEALLLSVRATFPNSAYFCTYGGEGLGSVGCTIAPMNK